MISHIRLFPLALGLIIGVICVFFIKPQQTVVYKYPTPESAGKETYKDKNGVCYKYNAKHLNYEIKQLFEYVLKTLHMDFLYSFVHISILFYLTSNNV